MLEPEKLLDYIEYDVIDKNKTQEISTIIYFGIGSKYHGNTETESKSNQSYCQEWIHDKNQQFPPFLHDMKLKFFNEKIKILIVLIDPAFNNEHCPFIVSNNNNFLHNSWKKSNEFANVYESTFDVSVIVLSNYIVWDDNCAEKSFNIVPILTRLAYLVSNSENKSLLFYHEYIGSDVSYLESIVKKSFDYDDNKVCIDITRGGNLSCFFNLTKSENYPLIDLNRFTNNFDYINPSKLTNEEIIDIVSKHKHNLNQSINDINITNRTNDTIIFFQIYKSDIIMIKLINESMLTTIRQLLTFNIDHYNKLGSNMYGIDKLTLLKNKLKFIEFDNIYYQILDNLKIIDDINLDYKTNINSSKLDVNYLDNINLIKDAIVSDLYRILKLSLNLILIKYDVKKSEIESFINKIQTIDNKYDIIKKYEEFVKLKMQM